MMDETAVTYEIADDGGWCAYAPEIPGVAVVGYNSRAEASEAMRIAPEMHFEGVREDESAPLTTPAG